MTATSTAFIAHEGAAARPVPHHDLTHRTLPTLPPPLSVVRTRPAPARAPFVVLIGALVVGGLVALLLLNTALTQGAFERKAVTRELRHLVETQQGLREHIAAVQEPEALAAHARVLGLVPSGCPVFLKLPTASVLGSPCPARAVFKVAPKPAVPLAPNGKAPAGQPPVANAPTGAPTTGTATGPAATVNTGTIPAKTGAAPAKPGAAPAKPATTPAKTVTTPTGKAGVTAKPGTTPAKPGTTSTGKAGVTAKIPTTATPKTPTTTTVKAPR